MSLKREREEWQGEDENGGNLMYVAGLRNDCGLRGEDILLSLCVRANTIDLVELMVLAC